MVFVPKLLSLNLQRPSTFFFKKVLNLSFSDALNKFVTFSIWLDTFCFVFSSVLLIWSNKFSLNSSDFFRTRNAFFSTFSVALLVLDTHEYVNQYIIKLIPIKKKSSPILVEINSGSISDFV